jgi:hypothetical protein
MCTGTTVSVPAITLSWRTLPLSTHVTFSVGTTTPEVVETIGTFFELVFVQVLLLAALHSDPDSPSRSALAPPSPAVADNASLLRSPTVAISVCSKLRGRRQTRACGCRCHVCGTQARCSAVSGSTCVWERSAAAEEGAEEVRGREREAEGGCCGRCVCERWEVGREVMERSAVEAKTEEESWEFCAACALLIFWMTGEGPKRDSSTGGSSAT